MSLLRSSFFNDPWLSSDFADLERTFHQAQREMNRTMDSLFHANRTAGSGGEVVSRAFLPRVDYHETDKEYAIQAELPGIPKEKVKVETHDDKLVLSGEVDHQHKQDKETASGKRVYLSERRWGKFERVIPLPPNADKQNIHASMENGILSLIVPKLPASQGGPRLVTIN